MAEELFRLVCEHDLEGVRFITAKPGTVAKPNTVEILVGQMPDPFK